MKITVFLGSSTGNSPVYEKAAEELGAWIGDNGHTLIYGGASVGLMGTLADAVLAGHGKVIGIMPEFMVDGHKNHLSLTEFRIVKDMTERKKMLLEEGDAFIAMPGGPGTLEEISDAVSSVRLRLFDKPCLFYNIDHYYDPMKDMFEKMIEEGFVDRNEISQVSFPENPADIRNILGKHAGGCQ